MSHFSAPRGQTIFRKGDEAKNIYRIKSGTVNFPQVGKSLGVGAVFGGIGVFAESPMRTPSAI
jgi:CRP-like cAMP-binding protein